MNPRLTLATAVRILRQLRSDHRTIAMMLVVPCVLVGLLAWSTVALALAAPGLQTVVAGLPNDHYHASLDPVVAILFGVSIAALLERGLDLGQHAVEGHAEAAHLGAGFGGAHATREVARGDRIRRLPHVGEGLQPETYEP